MKTQRKICTKSFFFPFLRGLDDLEGKRNVWQIVEVLAGEIDCKLVFELNQIWNLELFRRNPSAVVVDRLQSMRNEVNDTGFVIAEVVSKFPGRSTPVEN
jgi:hypothetical protein